MAKELRVNGDRVSVRESEGVKQVSKLIVPDSVKFSDDTGLEKHILTGEVIGKGQRCNFVDQGMKVLFGRQEAAPIEFEENKILIMRESAILFSFNDNGIDQVNNDRVLIEPDPMEKITASGLFIPPNANYEPVMGVILKVGNECEDSTEGQRVLFGKAAGAPVPFRGKSYLVLREKDIVGIVE